jgi:hypothetical protein
MMLKQARKISVQLRDLLLGKAHLQTLAELARVEKLQGQTASV